MILFTQTTDQYQSLYLLQLFIALLQFYEVVKVGTNVHYLFIYYLFIK